MFFRFFFVSSLHVLFFLSFLGGSFSVRLDLVTRCPTIILWRISAFFILSFLLFYGSLFMRPELSTYCPTLILWRVSAFFRFFFILFFSPFLEVRYQYDCT